MRYTELLLPIQAQTTSKMKMRILLQYRCHKAGTGRAGAYEIQHSLVGTAEGYSPVPPKDKTEPVSLQ